MVNFIMRTSINLAITAMVVPTNLNNTNDSIVVEGKCTFEGESTSTTSDYVSYGCKLDGAYFLVCSFVF